MQYSHIWLKKHPHKFHLVCTGINTLPLQLIGVSVAENQMCIKKAEISQHLNDVSYKITGMQLYWGFGNSVLFKLVVPLIFFFFLLGL